MHTHAETKNTHKKHGDPSVLDNASPGAEKGKSAVSSGLLGSGKIISSCTTVGSEMLNLGDTHTDGK